MNKNGPQKAKIRQEKAKNGKKKTQDYKKTNQGNKDAKGTLDSGINIGYAYQFLGFFPGATFLIKGDNAYFFQNIHYFMVWGMLVLRAMLHTFARV